MAVMCYTLCQNYMFSWGHFCKVNVSIKFWLFGIPQILNNFTKPLFMLSKSVQNLKLNNENKVQMSNHVKKKTKKQMQK